LNWSKFQNLFQEAANAVINASQHRIPGVVTQHGFDSWGHRRGNGICYGIHERLGCDKKMGKFIPELISILAPTTKKKERHDLR
jgi:hypothetical protein